MSIKRTILIAGASGFIGSKLTKKLSKENEVIAYGRSLRKSDADLMGAKFINFDQNKKNKLEVDCIVNCISNTNTQLNDWESYYDSNCKTTYSLLRNFNYEKFIQLSSFSVFEANLKEGAIKNPNNYYGLSKFLSEKMVEFESSDHKTFSIIRFPIVIGGGKTHKDIIDHIFDQSISNDEIELFNEGKHLRDLIHVKQAIKAIESLVNNNEIYGFNAFNIGSSDILSTLEICEYIVKKTSSNSKIKLSDETSKQNYDQLLSSANFLQSKNIIKTDYEYKSIIQNLDLYLSDKVLK